MTTGPSRETQRLRGDEQQQWKQSGNKPGHSQTACLIWICLCYALNQHKESTYNALIGETMPVLRCRQAYNDFHKVQEFKNVNGPRVISLDVIAFSLCLLWRMSLINGCVHKATLGWIDSVNKQSCRDTGVRFLFCIVSAGV